MEELLRTALVEWPDLDTEVGGRRDRAATRAETKAPTRAGIKAPTRATAKGVARDPIRAGTKAPTIRARFQLLFRVP